MKSSNPFHRNFLAALFILGGLAVTACKESETAPSTEVKSPELAGEGNPYPQTRNGWIPSDRPERSPHEGRTGGVDAISAELFFNELNWRKPEEEPFISIEISGTNMMRARLTPQSTPDRPEFKVIWRKPGENVEVENVVIPVYTTYASEPIGDKARVLELLKSFSTTGDDSFQSAVKWTEVKSPAASKPEAE